MCRTGAICRLTRLYSHRSIVCPREWHIIHYVLIVQSTVEWPEFRHVVHCNTCRNLRSSSFGRARCSAPIDIKELCLSISSTRSMTWSIVLVWKSSTAHIVLRGSCKEVRNTAFSSSSRGALVNWLFGQCLEVDNKLGHGLLFLLVSGVKLIDEFSLFHLSME